MKKQSLTRKAVRATVFLAVVLSIILSIAGYAIYTVSMDDMYKQKTSYGASYLAKQVDGDEVEAYIEKLRANKDNPEVIRDTRYQQIQQQIQYLCSSQNLTYLYITVITGDQMQFLFDSDIDSDLEGFGEPQPMYKESLKAYRKYMKNPEKYNWDLIVNFGGKGWMSSSAKPIFDSQGNLVAFACADKDMNAIKNARMELILLIIGVVGLAAFLVGSLITFILNRSILEPIRDLSEATSTFVKAKREKGESPISNLEIHTGDEIEELAESITSMEEDLHQYMKDITSITANQERIRTELHVAKRIQISMLPLILPDFPGREEFELYADMTAAKEVGGDFYDFFFVDENHFAIVIADVSGKGIPAALFMVIAKTLIKNQVQSGQKLCEAVTAVNDQLGAENDAGMFVTAWIGVLEISTRRMQFVNAGHNPPLLKRTNGTFDYLTTRTGKLLGILENLVYEQKEIVLDDGDSIFLYTDGVTEAHNSNRELYGEEHLKNYLNETETNAPEALIGEVHEQLRNFVQNEPQFDDITMLALRMTGVYHDITVTAEKGNINQVISFVEDDLKTRGCKDEIITPLKIVTDELFANVSDYSGSDNITVGCSYMNGQASIRFIDDGVPYNPLHAEDVDTSLSADERDIGGLGILLVTKLTDGLEHEYHDGKNIVTVRKR